MRARAYCLRDAYPDLLKGLGVVEERLDFEDTPAPITDFELPKPEGQPEPPYQPQGTVVEHETHTLAVVERAMHQSDTMEQLLKAGEMAKSLSELDQGTARITYKKMRKALLEDAEARGEA